MAKQSYAEGMILVSDYCGTISPHRTDEQVNRTIGKALLGDAIDGFRHGNLFRVIDLGKLYLEPISVDGNQKIRFSRVLNSEGFVL